MNRIARRGRPLIGIVILILLTLITTSCSRSIRDRNKHAMPLNMADFHQDARTWTYTETDAASTAEVTFTKLVVGQVQYHGHTAWLIVTTQPHHPIQMREYLTFDASTGTYLGIEMVDSEAQTVQDYPVLPGVRFSSLLAPGAPLVSSYDVTENGEIIHWKVESQILETQYEKVQVPAGTFDHALRVRTRVTTSRNTVSPPTSNVVTVEEDTWYVPEIGVVKNRTADGSRSTVLTDYSR
ncbi:MAG TPA: hypothetical protein GXZ82_03415 [Firmicutes bacterium]|jgi:hypothetical protein|nr:hypothetical protein [Bacillota bacterium]